MIDRARLRGGFAIAALALVFVATACQPLTVVGTGTSPSTPCYVGSWTVDGEQFLSPIATRFGTLTLTPQSSDLTLVLGSDNTWTFSGSQTVGVSGASAWGQLSGVVTVTGLHASGTYAAAGGNQLDFTLASLAASVAFDGTVNGQTAHYALSLPTGDDLDDLYGLSGTAQYSCSISPVALSLTFASFHLDL